MELMDRISEKVYQKLLGMGKEKVAEMYRQCFRSTWDTTLQRAADGTVFLITGIIPLVPGGGLYYTMDYLINGDFAMFTSKGIQTAAAAGAIAAGASMVTSLVRMLTWHKHAHLHT